MNNHEKMVKQFLSNIHKVEQRAPVITGPIDAIRSHNHIATKFEDGGRRAALEVLRFPSITHAKRYVRTKLADKRVVACDFKCCALTTFQDMKCEGENGNAAD